MKKILIGAVLLGCLIAGCKNIVKINYSGVFKLNRQVISGGGKDTVLVKEQVKIYTDHNYMYAGLAPDSSVTFGLGSYELDAGNKIVEHNIFNNRALDSTQIFVVEVKRTAEGRTQVIADFGHYGGAIYKSTEEYGKLPMTGASSLDGVWELNKEFRVKGKDTLRQHETRFKIFWGGHFMFIHRYPTNAVGTAYKNGFAYGIFSLKNDALSEETKGTSHAFLVNRKYSVKVTLNGADEYSQVIRDPKTNEQTTEVYKRMR
ncbi:MAG: hypothetical protein ACXVB0_06795 [Mucilaginibacter sp.]